MSINLVIDVQSGTARARGKWRPCLGWAILIVYWLFLACRSCGATREEAAPVPLWELRDPHWILASVGGLVFGVLRDFTFFVPVGFAALVLIPASSRRRRGRLVRLPGLAAGILFTILACVPGLARACCVAGVAGLMFPLFGCLLGAWAGATWLRGWRARVWFGPKIALLIALTLLCTGVVAILSLEDAPLPIESARPDPGEKQRLRRLIHGESPVGEDGTHTVRLTEHDANVLLSWGLFCESQKRKAAVRLSDDSVQLLMSLPIHFHERPRYLNLSATGSLGIEESVLRLRMNHCRIGSMEFPRPLLRVLSPLAASMLNHDRRVRPLLNATRRMIVEPNSIQVTYRPVDLPDSSPGKPVRPAMVRELLASTRIHVEHLLLFAASPLPDWQPSLNLCLKTVFTLARDRSTRGDAVTENQAAILALGILLGDARIDDFLGVAADGTDDGGARQVLARVVLHGRSDWTRHFCVSAAIAVLSDESTSDLCGLLKEELDADAGGSGFSFADLLVSRAGAVFAIRATRSTETARAMQDRLIRGFSLEELCPPAGDLPEGLSEADLQSRYGGVGGEGYRRLVEEIEQRVAACAAYR